MKDDKILASRMASAPGNTGIMQIFNHGIHGNTRKLKGGNGATNGSGITKNLRETRKSLPDRGRPRPQKKKRPTRENFDS